MNFCEHFSGLGKIAGTTVLGIVLISLGACSSGSLRIVSEPTGANVVSDGGKDLGVTPLVLEGEAYTAAMQGRPFFSATLKKDGYAENQIMIEPRTFDEFVVKLSKLEESHFRTVILKDYAAEGHKMVASFLSAQGSIGSKRLDQAEAMIRELQTNYPTMAAAYVLEADLRLLQKRRDEAYKAMTQAQRLAPNDPQIRKVISALQGNKTP
jgi:hypothetical protein